MWQTFLKKEEKKLIVPPGFTQFTVVGSNKGIYNIRLKRQTRNWTVVTAEGVFVRRATDREIYAEMRRYPKINCCFLNMLDSTWFVAVANNVVRVALAPYTVESPVPLTKLICRNLGGVVLFDNFDFRDTQPWRVSQAHELLHAADLNTTPPKWLDASQKTTFSILAENELANRVPETEGKIKDILGKEGANLLSMTETKKGYKLSFRFRGRTRKVEVKEDLTLLSSGMCLSGMDKYYALDSFIAILDHEDSGEYGDPVYY